MVQNKNLEKMPIHENVIKHFVNIELFHKNDVNREDCIGWITIMELADENLRSLIKGEKLDLEERRQIANGLLDGFGYLEQICGITHYDRKLENIVLVNGIPKIIDFSLVEEKTGRNGFHQMGYVRNGSKYKNVMSLCKLIVFGH